MNPPHHPPDSAPPPAHARVAPNGAVTVIRPPGADRLLLPPLINAHAHLELHRVGPRPYDPGRGFVGWVSDLRAALPDPGDDTARPTDRYFLDAASDAAHACLAQGVTHVGDIVRHPAVADAARAAGLDGVWFLERFGLGPPHDRPHLDAIAALPPLPAAPHLGLQPHAPYSAGPALYQAACDTRRPLATHLAETPDELAFVAKAEGPFRDFLERIDRWRPDFAAHYSASQTPVRWMLPFLQQRPWLLAHGNYLTDEDIDLLASLPADSRASIAYCPVAADYFGHRDHRYRDLLAAGVNVCLGTDSIVCQPPDEPQPYSIFNQMHHLHRRDGTDPATLLRMATTHAAALHLTDLDFTQPYSFITIDPSDPNDPLTQALARAHPVSPVDR